MTNSIKNSKNDKEFSNTKKEKSINSNKKLKKLVSKEYLIKKVLKFLSRKIKNPNNSEIQIDILYSIFLIVLSDQLENKNFEIDIEINDDYLNSYILTTSGKIKKYLKELKDLIQFDDDENFIEPEFKNKKRNAKIKYQSKYLEMKNKNKKRVKLEVKKVKSNKFL